MNNFEQPNIRPNKQDETEKRENFRLIDEKFGIKNSDYTSEKNTLKNKESETKLEEDKLRRRIEINKEQLSQVASTDLEGLKRVQDMIKESETALKDFIKNQQKNTKSGFFKKVFGKKDAA